MSSSLLIDQGASAPNICSNLVDVSFPDSWGRFQEPLSLTSIEDSLKKIGVCLCRNPVCLGRTERLREVVPACRWKPFRSWALVVVACYVMALPSKQTRLRVARDFCIELYYTLAKENLKSRQGIHEDVFGIWQVAYWVTGGVDNPIAAERFLDERELDVPVIRDAMNNMLSLKICQRRLWNLVTTCYRGIVDLPSIYTMLRENPQVHHEKHQDCTADLCLLDDDNSTTIPQIHKCQDIQNCDKQLFFDPQDNCVFDADKTGFVSTARDISHLQSERLQLLSTVTGVPTPKPEQFMAISHVWSDGTGTGQKPPGYVNHCLVKFFQLFAEKMGLTAIWWDTISLPTERFQKGIALERMHRNYEMANFTLVHDQQLIELDWKDDGSPCVALALSAWFSRGWTALELQQSKSVKILFRDPEAKKTNQQADKLIMKDLDQDILAKDGDPSAHLAHWAASSVIRKARQKGGQHIRYVVETLRPRYTSWTRDRMIIAALMLGLSGFKSTWSKTKITQEVLTRFNSFTELALLHGKVTMRTEGPWSWCPVSFLEFEDFKIAAPLEVYPDGEVTGWWHMMPLSHVEILYFRQSHPSIQLRIDHVLSTPEKCLLLCPTVNKNAPTKRCLLVLNLGIRQSRESEILQSRRSERPERLCQYIGTILASYPGDGFEMRACLGSKKDIHLSPDALNSISTKDYGGWTSLHVAAKIGSKDEVQTLLAGGADINATDDVGRKPAYWAKLPEVKELLELGV